MAAVEQCAAAGENDRRTAFRVLLERMNEVKDAGRFGDLAAALRFSLAPTLDYTSVQSLNRFYKALPPLTRGQSKIKLAILGGFTTHQLRDFIELYLFAAGVVAEIYEADYDVFQQEILNPSSGLYEFKPNVVYLATHWRNLGHLPKLSNSAKEVSALLEAEYRDWALLWQTAHDRARMPNLAEQLRHAAMEVVGQSRDPPLGYAVAVHRGDQSSAGGACAVLCDDPRC